MNLQESTPFPSSGHRFVALSQAFIPTPDSSIHMKPHFPTIMKTSMAFPIGAAVLSALHLIPGLCARPEVNDQAEGLTGTDWQGIRAAHEEWRHGFREVDGTWQARNPGQQWTTTFDGRGFLARPDGASWTWGLELRSYGFDGEQVAVHGRPEVKAEGQRLSYHWSGGLEEWYVNDHRGLEHGFVVDQRPPGAAEGSRLVFTLGTRGGLRPLISGDAQTVHFHDGQGAPVLHYAGLKVWDADGRILASRFEAGTGGEFRITVHETGARYPVTVDPVAQQAYVKASNSGQGDSFGNSVAISGDTVVVGALREDSSTTGVNGTPDEGASNSGAAYVFVRNGTGWSQQAYLKPGNTGFGDGFGISVAVSGDTLVIGADGEDSGTSGVNSTPDESASNSGAAYVFVRNGTTWSQQAYLKASNTNPDDRFGTSVAVSGGTVVVGAMFEDSSTTGVNSTPDQGAALAGAAYVFVRNGATWSQQAYLKAGNTGAVDFFGASVAVSDDTVVVGARSEDSSTTGVNSTPNEGASDSGAAYVFVRNGTTWSQQAYLKAGNTGVWDSFGHAVAVSGDTVIVGAQQEDSSTTGVNSVANDALSDSGAAYVFVRNGTTWSQQAYLKASNTDAAARFGSSVAVAGDLAVVGSNWENSGTTGVNSTPDTSASRSGAAYVFERSGTQWSQKAYLKAANTGSNDSFGQSVAVSGETVVVGSYNEDSGTTGINSTPDESAVDSGAAYIFSGFGSGSPEIAVEEPAGTDIPNGGSRGFGTILFGNAAFLQFTVRNTGNGPLALTGSPRVALAGDDASFFRVQSQPASPIAAGATSSFSVAFLPSAAGVRNATLSIACDDADENPFTLQISGTALSSAMDTDGDGVSDAAEFWMSPLGFDWQVNQPSLASALYSGASAAGLYTVPQVQANPGNFGLYSQAQYEANREAGRAEVIGNPGAYNLYTADSIMDLRMGGLMIQKQGSQVTLGFQPQTTPDLATQPFTDFGPPIITTIPMPEDKGFLRIKAKDK